MAIFHVVEGKKIVANVVAQDLEDVPLAEGQRAVPLLNPDAGPGWGFDGDATPPDGWVPVGGMES